jgi:hypothetical protein
MLDLSVPDERKKVILRYNKTRINTGRGHISCFGFKVRF